MTYIYISLWYRSKIWDMSRGKKKQSKLVITDFPIVFFYNVYLSIHDILLEEFVAPLFHVRSISTEGKLANKLFICFFNLTFCSLWDSHLWSQWCTLVPVLFAAPCT